ncbi:hypothetical protein QTP88_026132 [Uroleucon formosanum]
MEEFGIPYKLISLTKMCMEGTKYQVRVDNLLSDTFTVETGLKQGDALSPLLFNLALEKAVRMMQNAESGVAVNEYRVQILGFADDLNILGESLEDALNQTVALENAAAKVGLQINVEKTKILEILDSDPSQDISESIAFEKVEEFQYLGALLRTKNDWSREIGARIAKAERAFFALSKFFKSKALSKKTKLRLYTAIIRPTLTYGCEVWTTTSVTKRRLRTFENKIWRKICGPVRDAGTNDWRRKFNKELQEELGLAPVTSYIKGQRLQWFGHIMRRSEEETIRAVIEWQPEGKRPRGRPRKRWLDIIEEDLKTVGVEEWKEIIQDREKWRDTVMNSMDVICNPMANDEVCMKMPAAQQLNVPSTESIANKIQQLYNMFVSQAGTLDEQQLQTINLTVDSSLKVLYQQESKCMNDVEYREPANKNIDKQLRFYSTKKPRTKAPEEQRLNRPTIKVIKQIKSDLKGNEDTPYVNIDPHFEHSYGQFEQKKK